MNSDNKSIQSQAVNEGQTAARPAHALGIVAFVFSILAITQSNFPFAVAGLVMSLVAKKKGNNEAFNRVALILSAVSMGISVIITVVFVALYAVYGVVIFSLIFSQLGNVFNGLFDEAFRDMCLLYRF